MRLHVVAGILRNEAGDVLITERVDDGPFHGLWEFPGGKIKHGESKIDALGRELSEEIGIQAHDPEHFLHLQHDYPDRCVEIDFFIVSRWQNQPSGLEGQAMNWVGIGALDAGILLPANRPVIEALQNRFSGVPADTNSYNSPHSGESNQP